MAKHKRRRRRRRADLAKVPPSYNHQVECWLIAVSESTSCADEILKALLDQQGPLWHAQEHCVDEALAHLERARKWLERSKE